MTTETPRQWNMFTGELDDNRTARQKKRDREQGQPQQTEMFSQREIAQFGVNARPLLPLSPHTKLGLIFEDPRTEEEIERDRERAAQQRTYQMFDTSPAPDGQAPVKPDGKCLALIPYEAPCLAVAVIEQVSRAVIPWESVG